MSPVPDDQVLRIEDLHVTYPGKGVRAAPVEVLRGVDLTVPAGGTLGLVGESGSGKTTIGRAVLGLVPVSSGRIVYDGRPIQNAARRERRRLSREIQVVFQDPYTSLNPSMTVGISLAEPLREHGWTAKAASSRVSVLLNRVGLPSDAQRRLPREFSGGQRQRIAIARALTLEPRLIVCDEPVSALDLSTQRVVLDLLKQIQADKGVSYLFISHDLAVVQEVSNRVAVIAGGEIVEQGTTEDVTRRPAHPYTRRLLLSSPVADPVRQRARRLAYERERDRAEGVRR